MPKYILILLFSFCSKITISQSTIIFKPGPASGIDATVCSSPSWSTGEPLNERNFGNLIYLRNEAWTANSHGEPEHDWHSLIRFDALDTLENLAITSAHIKLFYPPNYPYANGGRSGFNETHVYRIDSSWEEQEVTWLNQPEIDFTDFIAIPANNDYDSIMVDVTGWVRVFVEDPTSYHGFLFMPIDGTPYRSMSFASSDHEDSKLWPELVIEYEIENPDSCLFEFPNVFTPDGNGINDSFGVVTNCESGYTVDLVIFDRWGNKVFSKMNTTESWDGTINGKAAISGVYIYSAEVVTEFGRSIHQGSLTLLR